MPVDFHAVDLSAPSPERLALIAECVDSFGIKATSARDEWPWNLLSKQTVVYASGCLARREDPIEVRFDQNELERIDLLSREVAGYLSRVPPALMTNAYFPFFLPAQQGQAKVKKLTPEVVRAAFRGTVHPMVTIAVQGFTPRNRKNILPHVLPLEFTNEHEIIWAELMSWFAAQKELRDPSFVQIGVYGDEPRAPRFLWWFTDKGSLAGICGYEVSP